MGVIFSYVGVPEPQSDWLAARVQWVLGVHWLRACSRHSEVEIKISLAELILSLV